MPPQATDIESVDQIKKSRRGRKKSLQNKRVQIQAKLKKKHVFCKQRELELLWGIDQAHISKAFNELTHGRWKRRWVSKVFHDLQLLVQSTYPMSPEIFNSSRTPLSRSSGSIDDASLTNSNPSLNLNSDCSSNPEMQTASVMETLSQSTPYPSSGYVSSSSSSPFKENSPSVSTPSSGLSAENYCSLLQHLKWLREQLSAGDDQQKQFTEDQVNERWERWLQIKEIVVISQKNEWKEKLQEIEKLLNTLED